MYSVHDVHQCNTSRGSNGGVNRSMLTGVHELLCFASVDCNKIAQTLLACRVSYRILK